MAFSFFYQQTNPSKYSVSNKLKNKTFGEVQLCPGSGIYQNGLQSQNHQNGIIPHGNLIGKQRKKNRMGDILKKMEIVDKIKNFKIYHQQKNSKWKTIL